MKVLVIDSHKSSSDAPAQNLHWLNARRIADHLCGDLIWSYPTVNDNIVGGYDAIVFVHASHYAHTDYAWLEASPDAKLFHVSNEYNLGEPRTLWMACKAGRKYNVIANHPSEPSKIVMKYVDDWHQVNLNALVYEEQQPDSDLFSDKAGTVYYGSYRKGREKYFKKYLNDVILSTHRSNEAKFQALGVSPTVVPRINWSGRGLYDFAQSLYIEDEVTHIHYNYLANRFYEAISFGCVPRFDESCRGTVTKSGYVVHDDFFVSNPSDLANVPERIPRAWHDMAAIERQDCLNEIKTIVEAA